MSCIAPMLVPASAAGLSLYDGATALSVPHATSTGVAFFGSLSGPAAWLAIHANDGTPRPSLVWTTYGVTGRAAVRRPDGPDEAAPGVSTLPPQALSKKALPRTSNR